MGRGVHFVRTVSSKLDYREDHRGIPFCIIVFMSLARAGAFYLLVTPPIFLAVEFGQILIASGIFWAMSIFYGISTNNFLDIFTPFGFHMFRWIITKRGNR